MPLFLFLPHFDVICDALATWNLFDVYNKEANYYSYFTLKSFNLTGKLAFAHFGEHKPFNHCKEHNKSSIKIILHTCFPHFYTFSNIYIYKHDFLLSNLVHLKWRNSNLKFILFRVKPLGYAKHLQFWFQSLGDMKSGSWKPCLPPCPVKSSNWPDMSRFLVKFGYSKYWMYLLVDVTQ